MVVQAEPPAATLGKQRAAASKMEWETKEAGHPILGNIRFAYLKTLVQTPVGAKKVYSRAYLSCQKAVRKLAIEVSNMTAPDDPKGLPPNADPKLFCNRAAGGDKIVREELLASWEVNELGDALAKGFRPFPLRECASISVVQEVALPAGWPQKNARVEFDIAPYNRELDSVFVSCGEVSAYGPASPPAKPTAVASAPSAAPGKPAVTAAVPPPAPAKPAVVAAAPAPAKPVIAAAGMIKPAPTPAPVQAPVAPPPKPVVIPAAAPPAAASAVWQNARTATDSKTNVRGQPNITGPVVTTLSPGAVLLAQKTGNEWWKVKAASGPAFEGYIRQDRLVFK